jgi:chemotaxis-related protein WspD
VVEPRPVHRIPHRAGTVLRGVANIRGELLLVVSLAALLGIAPGGDGASARARLLVIEHDGERWVFAVDELLGVHRVKRAALAPPPATVARDDRAATTALFDLGEVRVALLDEALLCGRLRRAVA